jgi:Skp family chaperone for outer membrane proteins
MAHQDFVPIMKKDITPRSYLTRMAIISKPFLKQHRSFALSLLFVAVLPLSAALADDTSKLPPPVIAIVDVQRILQESMAAKSVQRQIEAQRSKFQTEIEGEENELRQAEQDLSASRKKLSASAYADREQKLHVRFSTVETHVQERRKALDQAFTDSMNSVRDALLDVVDKTAHQHGANMVIVKQQALWVDPQFDVTDEVLKRLDQKLPKVDIAMPKEAPPQ